MTTSGFSAAAIRRTAPARAQRRCLFPNGGDIAIQFTRRAVVDGKPPSPGVTSTCTS